MLHRPRRVRAVLAHVLVITFTAFSASAEFLLNEVLYDPPGADGDLEFVELMLAGAESLDTAGLRLEFCNGSAPGEWRTLWSGAPSPPLAPGSLFLVGETGVSGADVHVALDLQNGPEALRLSRGETLLDLLGYGADLDPSLYEAWPAEDCSGLSLARRPDGVDSDQNVLDWFAVPPTPGELNLPDFLVRLERAEAPWLPLAPGEPCSLRVVLRNDGGLAWPAPLPVLADGIPRIDAPALAPGAKVELLLPLPPPAPGLSRVLLRAGDDSLSLPLRAGLGALQITELLFAPDGGEPEWIELLCREELSGLSDYRLEDLGGTSADFKPPPLAAGERILLTGDPDALLSSHPALDPARVLSLSPWPSLANGGSADAAPGWSDGLRLSDAEGRRVDGLLYRGDWIPAKGWSIERLDDFAAGGLPPWAPCPTGSTPLAGAVAPGFDREEPLVLQPNPFDPERERLWIGVRATGSRLELRIFDAAGRPVQRLEGSLGAGRLRLPWDGRDDRGRHLADGAYPLLARWRDPAGRVRELRAVVGLIRREGS